MRYRVGKHLGRTIYEVDDEAGTENVVGMLDTVELAGRVVAALNREEALGAALSGLGMNEGEPWPKSETL